MTHGNGNWSQTGPYGHGPIGHEGHPKPKKKGGKLKWIGIGAGVLLLVGFCSAAVTDSGSETTGSGSETTSASTSFEVTDSSLPPAPSSEEPQPATGASVPREHEQALKSAESYLRYSHFSYDGLYKQLTSEYGEGFPPDAAQYAVDNVDVDWNAEAVEAAGSYLEHSPFSRQGLIDQLVSEYGEGFTPEQAEYAVSQVY